MYKHNDTIKMLPCVKNCKNHESNVKGNTQVIKFFSRAPNVKYGNLL